VILMASHGIKVMPLFSWGKKLPLIRGVQMHKGAKVRRNIPRQHSLLMLWDKKLVVIKSGVVIV